MEPLSDIIVFVHVVESNSFKAAAGRLGMAKSALSRCVTRLEESLVVRLLDRTTRKLSLTEAGEAFFRRAERALADLDEARTEAARHQAEPAGTLRVTAPMSFGIDLVAPALSAFMSAHSKVSVELALDDRQRDIVADGIDVAFRIAQLADSTLVARRLAPIRQLVVAAPSYLEARGKPVTPDDLRDHDCLVYTLRASPDAWRFDGPGGR
jgi:DNA-binding transcriptional LysR family regulator